MSTSVPSMAVAVQTDPLANGELSIELTNGETVLVNLHTWSPRTYIEGIFKFGFFQSTDGVYYAASSIFKIKTISSIGEK